jgi:pectate lyase
MKVVKPGARAGWIVMALLAGASGCDARVYPLRDDSTGPSGLCPTELGGFATMGGSTTGGAGGPLVTASTLDAFTRYAAMSGPRVIQISGTLAFPADGDAHQIDVASDKTVVGLGAASGLLGGGLNLKQSQNVILRNLVIAKAVGTDAVTLQLSRNVWIDHCDLSSDLDHDSGFYDGLVDITHATDFVTVSWTRYHDHDDTGVIGHSADNGAEDTGHLTVTYHHNLFHDVTAGPTARFGSVHAYNNSFAEVSDHALASRSGAAMLVERNVFEGVVLPITTVFNDAAAGAATDVQNVVDASDGASDITMTTTWSPPYAYGADSGSSVPALVDACAGTGKIVP